MVEADHGRALAGARVTLLDSALVAVDSGPTDPAGRFRLAASPGDLVVMVEFEDHLTYTERIRVEPGDEVSMRISMPLVSVPAALVMREAISREAAFQLPLDELCREHLRPWEAGMLLGVVRLRRTMEPVPEALVVLEPLPPDTFAVRTRPATASGAFWFCNVPEGTVRVVIRARGLAPDTTRAIIRPGTISWYDGLLRPRE